MESQASVEISAINPINIEAFFERLDVTEGSAAFYRRNLRPFVRYILERRLERLEPATVNAYREALLKRGLSPSTVRNYLVALRRLARHLASSGLPDFTAGVKLPRQPHGFRKDVLSPDQIRALLRAIPRDSQIGRRDYAMVNLMIRTGLRTIELSRADIGDIRQRGAESVLWIQGKGRAEKDDIVVLTADTLGPIREYLAGRIRAKPHWPLFAAESDNRGGDRLTTRAISGAVKDRMRQAGIDDPRLTAHSLRHTAVTLALMAGASLQEAQAMARHRQIKTTMVYAHNLERLAHAPEHRIASYLSRIA